MKKPHVMKRKKTRKIKQDDAIAKMRRRTGASMTAKEGAALLKGAKFE